jgi:hypothetical protein
MTLKGDTVSATVSGNPKSAQLHYAVAEGPWQKREWKSVAAEVEQDRVTAKLPADRPIVYYFGVKDDRGLQTSAPHEILPGRTK